jgi:hypothetical protein
MTSKAYRNKVYIWAKRPLKSISTVSAVQIPERRSRSRYVPVSSQRQSMMLQYLQFVKVRPVNGPAPRSNRQPNEPLPNATHLQDEEHKPIHMLVLPLLSPDFSLADRDTHKFFGALIHPLTTYFTIFQIRPNSCSNSSLSVIGCLRFGRGFSLKFSLINSSKSSSYS